MVVQDDVRTAEIVASLSLATDLAMGLPLEHGLESAVLGSRLARSLGVDDATASEDVERGSRVNALQRVVRHRGLTWQRAIRSGNGCEIKGDPQRHLPLQGMEDITMLHKTRSALAVIAIVAVTVVFTAGSASAGVYGGGDVGYFGFGLVL